MFFKVTKSYLDAAARLINYHVRTREHSLTLRKDHLVGVVLMVAILAGLFGMLVPMQKNSIQLKAWVNAAHRASTGEELTMVVPRQWSSASGISHSMAQRIGWLCSRVIELESLGAELQALAGLDNGEFSFITEDCQSGKPSINSPKDSPIKPVSNKPEQTAARPAVEPLSLLNSRIDYTFRQLNAMREILSDRRFAQRSWPSGIPLFGATTANITSRYGYRTMAGSRHFHKGLDLGAPFGSAVLASGSGIVTYSGKNGKYGNLVEIDHGNGFVTRYGHNSENLVEVGVMVRRGQMIARVGSTGRSTGPHVHVEILSHGKAIDPELVLELPPPPPG